MVPYKLKIHGVRDFPPTQIPLGNLDEHILITGPNGVGKSTLAFCVGAILYSAKVDIEGLRSNNLSEDKEWNAILSLTFKNEGETKIDAPKFITFQLTIQQEAKSSLIKKEYAILSGDLENKLNDKITYKSGNTAGRNFRAYKDDLQTKYKIDPDLYYLVWYQQEVNQFASMNPEERFRQFSNMFDITNMQKEWETSLESVKEVENEMNHLQSIVKAAELDLRVAKSERDNYLNNKNLLINSGQRHYTFLTILCERYKDSLGKADESIKEMTEKITSLHEQIAVENNLLKEAADKVVELREEEVSLEKQLKEAAEKLTSLEKTDQQLRKIITELEEGLQAVSNEAKRLRYDEETTIKKRDQVSSIVKEIKETIERLKSDDRELRELERQLTTEIANFKSELMVLQSKFNEATKTIARFISSHNVEKKLTEANEEHYKIIEEIQASNKEKDRYERSIEQLRKNEVMSERQAEGLADLRKKGIKAYTLGQLVQLFDNAPLQLEDRIAPIKYTIFYDGTDYRPINDLYYVSLKKTVPNKVINEIRFLGLQIRHNLSEQMQNDANKALWWIEQFFNSSPKLEQNVLVDNRGRRGATERGQYILSDKALKSRLASEEEQLEEILNRHEKLNLAFSNSKLLIEELHGQLRIIKEAESEVLNKGTINNIELELKEKEEELLNLFDYRNEIEDKLKKLQYELVHAENEYEQLTKDVDLYEKLGAQAEQQLQLESKEMKLQQLQREINFTKRKGELLSNDRDERKVAIQNTIRLQKEKDTEISFLTRDLQNYESKKLDEIDEKDRLQYEILTNKKRLEELEKTLPAEALQIKYEDSNKLALKSLLAENEKARASLEAARSADINPNAENNYEAMKKDFDQKNSELTKSEILLETNRNRATTIEDKLETTINMHLTKINTLFQKYMDLFQFEGLIEKERIEEKSGRIKYLLFVKARKVGHQGALEDVSLKARHGKVGKGVSGGEESLSSLLFALALMQNLSISPSYIVLDEFDSALDDERKNLVFNLYASELKRKLIILSPKAHDETYYDYFSKVFIIEHNPAIPQSNIVGIAK